MVSNRQFDSCADVAFGVYVRQVSDWLAASYASEVPADTDARTAFAGRVIAAGEALGLHTKRDLAGFAATSALLGEGFERNAQHPWAIAVLRDESGDKGVRLMELAEIVRGERDAGAPGH